MLQIHLSLSLSLVTLHTLCDTVRLSMNRTHDAPRSPFEKVLDLSLGPVEGETAEGDEGQVGGQDGVEWGYLVLV